MKLPAIEDVCLLAGLGLATAGIYLFSLPAALVFAGLALVGIGYRIAIIKAAATAEGAHREY